MKKIYYILLIIVSLSIASSRIHAQGIEVVAPEEIGLNESFYVKYILDTSVQLQDVPVLEKNADFEQMGRPEVTKREYWAEYSDGIGVAYKYVAIFKLRTTLKAKAAKKKDIFLPQAIFSINGKKVKSDKKKINIWFPPQREDIDAFVKVIPSKKRIRIEDTISVSYLLYTTMDVSRIISQNIQSNRGLQAYDITPRRQYLRDEVIDGVSYKVFLLRKIAYQPRNLGPKVLKEGEIVVEYDLPTGRKQQDFWGRVYEEVIKEQKVLPIEEITIRVENLIAI